ncbi:laminin B (Domain IV) domain-containing protein [Phthorimaea operculella]|nr:laminin B (Domain IV) domain-containing protein [Phthorimaea operculella]
MFANLDFVCNTKPCINLYVTFFLHCSCKENVIGRVCDHCVAGHYAFPDCVRCSCDPDGTTEDVCDQLTAHCFCKKHVRGQLNIATRGPLAFPECVRCSCDPDGTTEDVCDQLTAHCFCKKHVRGQLNIATRGPLAFPECVRCSCDPDGTTEDVCDQLTAHCFCKKHVRGQLNIATRGPLAFPECVRCSCDPDGTTEDVCDQLTAHCFCKKHVRGQLNIATRGPLAFPECVRCSCDPDGTTEDVCDQLTAHCFCKKHVRGQLNIATRGPLAFPECVRCSCDPDGTTEDVCDQLTAHCFCKKHVRGQLNIATRGPLAFPECVRCSCDPDGTTEDVCDQLTAHCFCKKHVRGQLNIATRGPLAFPECVRCSCDPDGTTEDVCDQLTAHCFCKKHVRGQACDTCQEDYFNLQPDNPDGCTKCHCFGKTTRCTSSYNLYWAEDNPDGCTKCHCFGKTTRCTSSYNLYWAEDNPGGCTKCHCFGKTTRCTSSYNLYWAEINGMTDWYLANVEVNRTLNIFPINQVPAEVNEKVIGAELPESNGEKIVYFGAPDYYLGKRLTSYGGYLTYTVYYTTKFDGRAIAAPDVILGGASGYIIHNRYLQTIYDILVAKGSYGGYLTYTVYYTTKFDGRAIAAPDVILGGASGYIIHNRYQVLLTLYDIFLKFLKGHTAGSYGGYLTYTVYYTTKFDGRAIAAPDVILGGASGYIIHNRYQVLQTIYDTLVSKGSYGGYLTYTVYYTTKFDGRAIAAPDVILGGASGYIIHNRSYGGYLTYTVYYTTKFDGRAIAAPDVILGGASGYIIHNRYQVLQTIYDTLVSKGSYGGYLTYTVYYTTKFDGRAIAAPDVILGGASGYIIHNSIEQPPSLVEWTHSVRLSEDDFVNLDNSAVSKDQFMNILVNVTSIYIRATYEAEAVTIRLNSVTLDVGVEDYVEGAKPATSVEQCQCPAAYRGTSCEQCVEGHYRLSTGPHQGFCIPCTCNGHADACDVTTGVCLHRPAPGLLHPLHVTTGVCLVSAGLYTTVAVREATTDSAPARTRASASPARATDTPTPATSPPACVCTGPHQGFCIPCTCNGHADACDVTTGVCLVSAGLYTTVAVREATTDSAPARTRASASPARATDTPTPATSPPACVCTGPHQGFCIPCTCNGHADACDVTTGVCLVSAGLYTTVAVREATTGSAPARTRASASPARATDTPTPATSPPACVCTGPHQGFCIPCTCNGHADACDVTTGVCLVSAGLYTTVAVREATTGSAPARTRASASPARATDTPTPATSPPACVCTGPHQGFCIPCTCNGHADACDVTTGVCLVSAGLYTTVAVRGGPLPAQHRPAPGLLHPLHVTTGVCLVSAGLYTTVAVREATTGSAPARTRASASPARHHRRVSGQCWSIHNSSRA